MREVSVAFFFSSRRRHTRSLCDWSSDVCSSDLASEPVILAGHSMGAHALTAYALSEPERVAAVVAIGPAYAGTPLDPESAAYWDRLANGLEEGGVEGFIDAYDHDLPPEWRDTVLRITRDRL